MQKKLRTRAWREGQKIKEAPTEQDEVLDIYEDADADADLVQIEVPSADQDEIANINQEPSAKRVKKASKEEAEEESDFYQESSVTEVSSSSEDSDDQAELPPIARYW